MSSEESRALRGTDPEPPPRVLLERSQLVLKDNIGTCPIPEKKDHLGGVTLAVDQPLKRLNHRSDPRPGSTHRDCGQSPGCYYRATRVVLR